MFQPLFRALSTFVLTVGFLAGATGVFALVFAGDAVRFGVLLALAVIMAVAGIKMRERAGELNIVAFLPEDIASSFEIAKALGLGIHADAGMTALAGAIAGGVTVLGVGLAGFITAKAFPAAVGVMAIFGGFLGLAKKRALKAGRFIVKNGKRYGSHRRISQYVVPIVTVVWMVLSAPEADPIILAIIAGGLLWWIGSAFHYIWETLHTAVLVLIYKEDAPQTVEWGLEAWLRFARSDSTPRSVEFRDGTVTLSGEFPKQDELSRDLRKMDFIRRVDFKQSE